MPALTAAAVTAAFPAGDAEAAVRTRVLQGWPCAGCVVVAPVRPRSARPPLLVALHGDEGSPGLVVSVWARIAAANGAVLFAPQCPTDEGCRFANGAGATNSWWGWLQSGHYDDGWLGRQTALVEKRFHVRRTREYLEGWSGGADFLGWYALRHADRFAAAAFVAGGVPYSQTCPARPLAAFFLGGSADFRTLSGQPGQVQQVLQRCGDRTTTVVQPGADHQATIMGLETAGYASTIMRWLLQQRLGG